MTTIACVSVGNYRGAGARYVNALFRGCRRHLTIPFRFVCFTDDASGLAEGIEPRLIAKGLVPSHLHGVYSKIAMFRAGAFEDGERVLFLDLDVVVLSNFDDIALYRGPFAMIRDPWRPHALNSTAMAFAFGPNHHDIWNTWVEAGFPQHRWGDQGWISDRLGGNAVRLQDVFPARLLSFNIDCRKNPTRKQGWLEKRLRLLKYHLLSVPYPKGASIVYFHGEPKPDNCFVSWVQSAWATAP